MVRRLPLRLRHHRRSGLPERDRRHGVSDAVHRPARAGWRRRPSRCPKSTTAHEAGHQWWYGIVATNEFEHAWMDEGINTFATARALEAAMPPFRLERRFFGGFIPWVIDDITVTARRPTATGSPATAIAAEAEVPVDADVPLLAGHGGDAISYNKTVALAAHARAASRLAGAAADPGHLLRALEVHAPAAGGLLRGSSTRSAART